MSRILLQLNRFLASHARNDLENQCATFMSDGVDFKALMERAEKHTIVRQGESKGHRNHSQVKKKNRHAQSGRMCVSVFTLLLPLLVFLQF